MDNFIENKYILLSFPEENNNQVKVYYFLFIIPSHFDFNLVHISFAF